MKSDVIIIGSELDAFVASIRLNELGFSTRIFSNGKGSLLYSLGNIKILNLIDTNIKKNSPYSHFHKLNLNHPYNIIGKENVKKSIDWFFGLDVFNRLKFDQYDYNINTLSPIGLKISCVGLYYKQICFNDLENQEVSIVEFENYKDFHSELIAKSIKKFTKSIEIIKIKQPDISKNSDSSALAISFDNLENPENYFNNLKKRLNKNSSIVIFPAVMGLNKYIKVIQTAEKILNKKCVEAPTLPPSIPAIRLNLDLEKEAMQHNNLHKNSIISQAKIENKKCLFVKDNFDRTFTADTFIVSNGGILMGGLKVYSNGDIKEKIFNPKIQNNNHLLKEKTSLSLNALQTSGVVTNKKLNPFSDNNSIIKNIFYTGRNLANWNPSTEFSGEGVSIASGWYTANNIAEYMDNN
jgi:glycerol-3-phosphate dehydrogenase subunit B